MFDFLYPDYYFRSVHDIPLSFFEEKEIKCILFDIDNTLEAYQSPLPSEKTQKLFCDLKEKGIKLAVVSNNHEERVCEYCKALEVPYSFDSGKPSSKRINEFVKALGVEKKNTAIIGDQLFTDIWASNNSRITGILVDRINSDESFFIRVKRVLEKPVFNKIKKKGFGRIK